MTATGKISSKTTPDWNVPQEALPYLDRIPTDLFTQKKCGTEMLEEESYSDRAAKILKGHAFDYCMGCVIIANLLVMIIETDHAAAGYDTPLLWTEVFGYVALTLFVVELLLRLWVYKCSFWKDRWNVFDFIVVFTDSVFCVLGLVFGNLLNVSMLRVFRLAKLARVSKVLRVFPELRLLLAALMSSFSAIFWGAVLLGFCLIVWSMVAVQFLHPLNEKIDYGDCERCPRAYNSVLTASLTFWQQIVTGDSWGLVTIPLIEEYPQTAFFFIPMFLTVGMAVTNLILGVVVSVAQESKDQLEEEERTEKAFNKLNKKSQLLELCRDLDSDKTGWLDYSEINSGFRKDGQFREIILSLDITEEDFDIILAVLDPDKSGFVSYKDLVSHLCTMKSSDQQFMLAWIKYYITSIRNNVREQLELQQKQILDLINMKTEVQDGMKRMQSKEEDILDYEKLTLKSSQAILEGMEAGVQKIDATPLQQTKLQVRSTQKHLEEMRVNVETNRQSSTRRFPANSAANLSDIQRGTKDDMEIWLQKVCRTVEAFQVDLKHVLKKPELSPVTLPVSDNSTQCCIDTGTSAEPASTVLTAAMKISSSKLLPEGSSLQFYTI